MNKRNNESTELRQSGWHSNPTIVECWYLEKTAKNDKRLKRIDVDILGWLLHHANSQTGQCNPGIETIAAYDNISRETVSPSLKRLKQCDYIKWRRTGLSNQYTFNLSMMKTREELFQAAGLIHYSERKAKMVADAKISEMSSDDDIRCHQIIGEMSSDEDIRCHQMTTQTTKLTTKRTTKRTTCEEEGLREEGHRSESRASSNEGQDASIDVTSSPEASIDDVRPIKNAGWTSRQAVTRPEPIRADVEAAFDQVCSLHPGYQEDYLVACAKKFAAIVKSGVAPKDIVKAAEFAKETNCTTYLFNWLDKGDWKKYAAPYGGETLEEILQRQLQWSRDSNMKREAQLRADAEEWLSEVGELPEAEEFQELFIQ